MDGDNQYRQHEVQVCLYTVGTCKIANRKRLALLHNLFAFNSLAEGYSDLRVAYLSRVYSSVLSRGKPALLQVTISKPHGLTLHVTKNES
jgi:hypothetical protein